VNAQSFIAVLTAGLHSVQISELPSGFLSRAAHDATSRYVRQCLTEQEIKLHRVWSETSTRLDVLRDRVSENKEVMAALDFARWLFWSGLLELLEMNSREGPLKVDGANLRWKCQELQSACQDRFRTNGSEPRLAETQLRSINEKLDMIAGFISKVAVGACVPPAAAAPAPIIQVFPGGLDHATRSEKRA
jgi:hypothetical protein